MTALAEHVDTRTKAGKLRKLELIREAISLRGQGFQYDAIAEAIHVSPATISMWIFQYGPRGLWHAKPTQSPGERYEQRKAARKRRARDHEERMLKARERIEARKAIGLPALPEPRAPGPMILTPEQRAELAALIHQQDSDARRKMVGRPWELSWDTPLFGDDGESLGELIDLVDDRGDYILRRRSRPRRYPKRRFPQNQSRVVALQRQREAA